MYECNLVNWKAGLPRRQGPTTEWEGTIVPSEA